MAGLAVAGRRPGRLSRTIVGSAIADQMRVELFDKAFHNRRHRHRSLAMLAPAQFETITHNPINTNHRSPNHPRVHGSGGIPTMAATGTYALMAVAGLVSFGVGLIVAWAMLRRARAKLRRARPDAQWSWEEWRAADQIGGRWAWLISIATFMAVAVGVYGFGTPSWLRAGLIGVVAGVCLPPFLYGIWLLLHSDTEDERS